MHGVEFCFSLPMACKGCEENTVVALVKSDIEYYKHSNGEW